MNKNDTVIFLILLAISGGMLYGANHLVNRAEGLRDQERNLRVQELHIERQSAERVRQIEIYKRAISRLEQYQIEIPENEVDFYAWVQGELTNNALRSDRVDKTAASSPERHGVQLDFQGPYYSFVKTLSDWRNLKVALRLSSLTLTRVDSENTKGVAVMESVLKE